MVEDGQPQQGVQDLGESRLHPGAASGGNYDHAEARGRCRGFVGTVRTQAIPTVLAFRNDKCRDVSSWRARIRTWNKGSKGPCDTFSPRATVRLESIPIRFPPPNSPRFSEEILPTAVEAHCIASAITTWNVQQDNRRLFVIPSQVVGTRCSRRQTPTTLPDTLPVPVSGRYSRGPARHQ